MQCIVGSNMIVPSYLLIIWLLVFMFTYAWTTKILYCFSSQNMTAAVQSAKWSFKKKCGGRILPIISDDRVQPIFLYNRWSKKRKQSYSYCHYYQSRTSKMTFLFWVDCNFLSVKRERVCVCKCVQILIVVSVTGNRSCEETRVDLKCGTLTGMETWGCPASLHSWVDL